jgi:Uma2 family endonuclease
MMTSPQEYQQAVLEVLPDQGLWSEERYLWLTDYTSHLIEFTDGYLEVLPMPTDEHQGILAYLEDEVKACPAMRHGVVRFSPLRLRLREGKIREPDLLLLLDRNDPRRGNRYWSGADLVMEVVSPDKPGRDLVEKREEYAEAGIPEYWIVDPRNRTITVLTLEGDTYREHGVFAPGAQATSVLLAGFAVDVRAAFAAA